MDKKIWEHPELERSLNEAETPLWFWNDKLEKEELLRQLKMQTEIGVTCTNPHARTNGGEGFIGGYLDDEWFENIKTVLDYKKEHGETMWLYDEIDWPAGTCGKTITRDERNREQYVEIEEVKIPAGETFRSQLMSFEGQILFGVAEDTDKSDLCYNTTIVDAQSGEPYRLEDFFIYDMFGPELEFKAQKDAIAFITRIHVDAYDMGGDEQVNYLDADATRAFLASTYDKYYERFGEDFGGAIQCVFNDETRMCHAIPWSREFAAHFKQQKGYEIRKEIYQLIIPGEKAGRIRVDYLDMVGREFQENYFGEIHRWCEKHDLKLFAHLLAEETMVGHARYSGDYLRQNRYQDVCGADYLGKGVGSLNIKFTACGAHSYGKKRTAVETFAGCGWDMTFEEYTRIVTWLFQQGMQIIINHGFFYSDRGNRKNDWPPSQFFQWQGWPRMKEGNQMIRRLQYAMTDGINEADVLVYHPLESFQMYYLPDQHFTHAFFHGAFTQNERAARIDREQQLFLNALTSANVDFDLLHRDAVENFTVEKTEDGAVILNTKSGQRFSVLVLPMCYVLPAEAAKLCEAFTAAGGTILALDTLPVYAAEGPAGDDGVQRIFAQMDKADLGSAGAAEAGKAKEALAGKVLQLSVEAHEEILKVLGQLLPHPVQIVAGTDSTVNHHPCYDSYLIDPYMHTGEDISGVMFVRYLKGDCRNVIFMNYSAEPETIEVQVESSQLPQVWDTLTGQMQEAEVVSRTEGSWRIRMTLPCDHSLVVVTKL